MVLSASIKAKSKEPSFPSASKASKVLEAGASCRSILLAIPATKTLIAMEDSSKAVITFKVTGSQWKWHYEYLGHDVDFFSVMSTPMSQINNEESKSEKELYKLAIEWSVTRGSRSGRVAWQFIVDMAGKLGQNINKHLTY